MELRLLMHLQQLSFLRTAKGPEEDEKHAKFAKIESKPFDRFQSAQPLKKPARPTKLGLQIFFIFHFKITVSTDLKSQNIV